jgi:hypothetical protein
MRTRGRAAAGGKPSLRRTLSVSPVEGSPRNAVLSPAVSSSGSNSKIGIVHERTKLKIFNRANGDSITNNNEEVYNKKFKK